MRARGIICALLVIPSMVGCSGSNSQSDNVQPALTVQECFGNLKAALSSGNGAGAVKHVTPATLDIYERCRRLALDSSGTDFELLSQGEVLLIFQLRWLSDKATLGSMDGAGVFSWGVENGLLKKDTLDNIQLDKVQPEGDKAVSTLLNRGRPVTDTVFHFELHAGVWRLAFERILRQAETGFAALREEANKTKIELAIYLLEKTYDQQVPPQILNGPLK